ncbi:MAG: IS1380 family transposase [Nostocaceae cyanobacterium]|nr:IS1380 family transposase [Nostocaceae cyanobacterium]
MSILQEYSLNFNPRMKVNFEGGDLTSDAGLLLYKSFDHKLGFSKTVKELLVVNDNVIHRDHPNSDVVIQKIYQHVAGYHTDDHADDLQAEPLLTAILAKERLASQPTLSRFHAKSGDKTVKSLEKITEDLQRRVYKTKPANQVIFDVDSSGFIAYGEQDCAEYNAHYQQNGFHPLFCFDGLTGDCLQAELRPGNVYTSRDVAAFMKPLFNRYEVLAPDAFILVRGDSGFATPELYELVEAKRKHYIIRLKANAILQSKAQTIADENLDGTRLDKYQVYYAEFPYQAKAWNCERRVVVKMEKPAGELLFNFTYMVTTLALSPEDILRIYCNRGKMENFIKEAKNGFACQKMSSTHFQANEVKLQISLLAYNFNNWFRRLCLPEKVQASRMETLRTNLVKIAAKLVHSGRYWTWKLCSSCVYKNAFRQTLENIGQMPQLE